MKNFSFHAGSAQTPVMPLKESIRDMIRLQGDYQIPDELFWQLFNTRVLLNQRIDVNAFFCYRNGSVAHP